MKFLVRCDYPSSKYLKGLEKSSSNFIFDRIPKDFTYFKRLKIFFSGSGTFEGF